MKVRLKTYIFFFGLRLTRKLEFMRVKKDFKHCNGRSLLQVCSFATLQTTRDVRAKKLIILHLKASFRFVSTLLSTCAYSFQLFHLNLKITKRKNESKRKETLSFVRVRDDLCVNRKVKLEEKESNIINKIRDIREALLSRNMQWNLFLYFFLKASKRWYEKKISGLYSSRTKRWIMQCLELQTSKRKNVTSKSKTFLFLIKRKFP